MLPPPPLAPEPPKLIGGFDLSFTGFNAGPVFFDDRDDPGTLDCRSAACNSLALAADAVPGPVDLAPVETGFAALSGGEGLTLNVLFC